MKQEKEQEKEYEERKILQNSKLKTEYEKICLENQGEKREYGKNKYEQNP